MEGWHDGMNSETLETSPALEAVRTEISDIMSNQANPRHLGFQQGDATVRAYVDGLYEKALATTTPGPITTESFSAGGAAHPQEGETLEEAEVRERNEVILAPLKTEWGPNFEQRFASAMGGMRTLFEGRGDVLDELGTIVRMEYGPRAETAALRFLAELEHIKQGG